MNLGRSVNNLAKRFDKYDSVMASSNKTGLSIWKGKPIIPFDEWIEIRNTPYALKYFPDDFDQDSAYIREDEVVQELEDVRKWDSDYQELMEYTKNTNYGRLKCFHCLLSPNGDDQYLLELIDWLPKG